MVFVALVASACSSDSSTSTNASGSNSSGSGGGLSGVITLITIPDNSGSLSVYGQAEVAGQQFAVDEINSTHFLGDATLKLEVIDATSDVQPAVDGMTKAVSEDAPVVFSPFFSTQVQSMVPIAQREKVPFIAVEAGVPGIVETGDYIFRITPPQSTLVHKTSQCMADLGVKKVAMIYQASNATISGLAKDTFPSLFKDANIDVVANEGYPTGTSDFSAIVSKVLSSNPDSIGVLPSGADAANIITQLNRQGYTGALFGQAGLNAAILKPAGAAADGTVWAASFSAGSTTPSSKKFTDAFTAAKGAAPDNFNAESYDGVWLAARAIKDAGSSDRAKVQASLVKLTQQGMDGAMGHVTFENRDARLDGVLIQFSGGATKVVDKCSK
jgi:branched-chain amino acid transport system substrate-binding protein